MMYSIEQSKLLFEKAQGAIPGGVNSPVRAFRSVGGTPLFMERAEGAYLFDADGNKYIDYIASWGPMILGHAYPKVVEAIRRQVGFSTSYGAPTRLETEMAELIKEMCPNIDLVRMVNSGTEACMSALRVARGYTGKNKVIKFEGCYHGHADSFLVKAGSGVATLAIQSTPGIPQSVSDDTLTCAYNDLSAVEEICRLHKGNIAAIIVEPVAGNMGCILPENGFLEGIRKVCDEESIVLIFDEVMTGFRLSVGGAQSLLGVNADLVTYGKVIGGGLPVGAFGGKREIMETVAPTGKVYQAGTLSGNPIAMTAGLTLLRELRDHPEIYSELAQKTEYLSKGITAAANEKNINLQVNSIGSMLSIHFSAKPVTNFATAAAADNASFNRLFHHLLSKGIYLPPSPFESWFLNNALTYADIDKTLELISEGLENYSK